MPPPARDQPKPTKSHTTWVIISVPHGYTAETLRLMCVFHALGFGVIYSFFFINLYRVTIGDSGSAPTMFAGRVTRGWHKTQHPNWLKKMEKKDPWWSTAKVSPAACDHAMATQSLPAEGLATELERLQTARPHLKTDEESFIAWLPIVVSTLLERIVQDLIVLHSSHSPFDHARAFSPTTLCPHQNLDRK